MQAEAVVVSQYLFAVALEWLFFKTSYNEIALKCKPSANYACAIPLIDGLGRSMRGLPLVAHGESDTG